MKFEHTLALIAAFWLICWGIEYKSIDDITKLCETNGRFADNAGLIWECRGVGGFIDEYPPSVVLNPARLGLVGQ